MPRYVYLCANGHKFEASHSYAECDLEHCCPECGAVANRVPQATRWYRSPWDVYYEKAERKFREYKRKQLAKTKR